MIHENNLEYVKKKIKSIATIRFVYLWLSIYRLMSTNVQRYMQCSCTILVIDLWVLSRIFLDLQGFRFSGISEILNERKGEPEKWIWGEYKITGT
jgi:hypothetical protein